MKPLTIVTSGCLIGWFAMAGAAALAQERPRPGGSEGQARPAHAEGATVGHAVARESAPMPSVNVSLPGGGASSGAGEFVRSNLGGTGAWSAGWLPEANFSSRTQERPRTGGSEGQARPVQGGGSGGHAVPRGSAPTPSGGAPSSGGGVSSGGGSGGAIRGGGEFREGGAYRGSSRSNSGGGAAVGQAVPRGSRPRGDAPTIGSAAPRGTVDGGQRPPYYPGYYPPYYPGGGYNWGWPGYGYGGYYGYWGFGLSFYYDPWFWGSWYGYPGYYGNPWHYGYPGYYGYGPGYGYAYATGEVKLKVKPKEAEVYVDGAFVGNVDEFDGTFQSLRLSAEATSGAVHRIEIRYPGFETIAFEVRLFPGQQVTYRGELRPVGAPAEPPK